MAVYAGDITTLNADAVVNSAAVNLTGCYIPLHNCIDNIVHSRAGIQLRNDCAAIIRTQGCVEEAGNAKITSAYNLPCRYILHTVGPRVALRVGEEERALLKSSYQSCLSLAKERGLHSTAFCCISTGVFNFPADEAAEIAVGSVQTMAYKKCGISHEGRLRRIHASGRTDLYGDPAARIKKARPFRERV